MRSGECGNARPGAAVQGGFTMIAVLAASFLLALASQQVVRVVSQQAQRDREAELLRIGGELARAISDYHDQSPGTVKEWPQSLEVLTNDRRFVTLRRHLRRVYDDPISRSGEWGLVMAQGGGIVGVYSRSSQRPIRTAGAELKAFGVESADTYSGWKFLGPSFLRLRPVGAPLP